MSSGRTIALDLDHGPIIPPYWTPPPPTGSGKWLHDKPGGGIEWAAITPADVGLDRPYYLSLFGASVAGSSTRQPIINWYSNPDGTGDVLKWQTGLDVANGANDDLVLAARNNGSGGVADFLYLRAFGNPPKMAAGFNMTPPIDGAVLQVTPVDGSDWKAITVRMGPGSTGDAFYVFDSGSNPLFQIGSAGGVFVKQLRPLNDPGGIVIAPQTPGNSGQAMVSYRGNIASAVGIDYVPNGNDMVWQLRTTSNGGVVAAMSTFVPLTLSPQANADALDIVQPPGGGTASMLSLRSTLYAELGGFDPDGRYFTNVHSAPPDASLAAGEMRVWFDQTSGAAKMMVKAKDAGGTVRTGSLALT